MKKFMVFTLLVLFIFGGFSTASAIHTDEDTEATYFEARGTFKAAGLFKDNLDFSQTDEDSFSVAQRARVYFEFAANENVKYVFGAEIGTDYWGDNNLDAGGDPIELKTKHSYLDFNLGEANIKVGQQWVALPGHHGSEILANDMPALVASMPINEMFAITAGYSRPRDDSKRGVGVTSGDDVDVFFLSLPISADQLSLTPFFAYRLEGKNVSGGNQEADTYWAGFSGTLDLNPISIMADFNYGDRNSDDSTIERSGWYTYLAADYKMDMFTPELYFFYGSGNDDADQDGVMPNISGDHWVTTFLFDGSTFSNSGDTFLDFRVDGMTGLGLKLKGIQFMDKLTHDFGVLYVQGTNDDDGINAAANPTTDNMTDNDSILELTFDTKYQIYESLSAIAEVAYASPDFDDSDHNNANDFDENAWKLAIGFSYGF